MQPRPFVQDFTKELESVILSYLPMNELRNHADNKKSQYDYFKKMAKTTLDTNWKYCIDNFISAFNKISQLENSSQHIVFDEKQIYDQQTYQYFYNNHSDYLKAFMKSPAKSYPNSISLFQDCLAHINLEELDIIFMKQCILIHMLNLNHHT